MNNSSLESFNTDEQVPQQHAEGVVAHEELANQEIVVPIKNEDEEDQIAALGKEIKEIPSAENSASAPEGTIFTPPQNTERKHASFWKKAAVFGGMALGLFANKEARSQDKTSPDKKVVSKEIKIDAKVNNDESLEYQDISEDLKDAYNGYVQYMVQNNLQHDPGLSTFAGSKASIERYIQHVKATGGSTILTSDKETAKAIQSALLLYRNSLNKLEKEVEASTKPGEKMRTIFTGVDPSQKNVKLWASITTRDGILGPESLHEFPHVVLKVTNVSELRSKVGDKVVGTEIGGTKSVHSQDKGYSLASNLPKMEDIDTHADK